ncbi:MAG: sugar ABC transporter substrate-binding protein [Alphaproteobacteria bacterium]|nr:sugar ABC transporter substrate-binding protein [Alphaproteobacteria bacterium]
MAAPRTLAIFTKNRTNPAYAAARLAADRIAAAAGARTVHYVPETPDDVAQQKALVGEALAARPDAVVFVPVDDRQMVPDVARLVAAGLAVVTCINRLEVPVASHVGSDDVAVGETAAKALIDALAGRGRVVAIEGTPAAPTSRDRTVGLRKALAEHPDMRLLGTGVGSYQQAPARQAMARLLAQHPAIDGVWTANDVMAFGALEALAAAGRTAKVVGVNGLPEAIDHIERGTMLASVDFSAFAIAATATQAALRRLRGEPVPATIMVPAELIDRRNVQRWKVPFADRPLPVWEEVVG